MSTRPNPSESPLTGSWIVTDHGVQKDDVALRIDELVRDHLTYVATTADGWSVLYVEPSEGQYWELTYPESEQQGGGPASLAALSDEQAAVRYRIDASQDS